MPATLLVKPQPILSNALSGRRCTVPQYICRVWEFISCLGGKLELSGAISGLVLGCQPMWEPQQLRKSGKCPKSYKTFDLCLVRMTIHDEMPLTFVKLPSFNYCRTADLLDRRRWSSLCLRFNCRLSPAAGSNKIAAAT